MALMQQLLQALTMSTVCTCRSCVSRLRQPSLSSVYALASAWRSSFSLHLQWLEL